MTPAPPALDRLAIHTWTTRPLTLSECISAYRNAGVGGISVWREHIAPIGAAEAARMLRDSGLRVPALVRAGFFVDADPAVRAAAIEDCRVAVAEAAAIRAENLVIVAGARPEVPLADAHAMVRDALLAVADHAGGHAVRLAIEPLHPVFASTRSCITTLAQARDLITHLNHPALGVAVDVYHIWQDPDAEAHIAAIGRERRLFAFHVCDWKPGSSDPLNDRGLMGEGCINIPSIRSWVDSAGFDGMIEVEIFSRRYWSMDQAEYLRLIRHAYLTHV